MSDYTFIKNKRKELNMTQQNLADEAGVTSAYIQQLENNVKQNPSFEVFCKIIDALELDINDIMGQDRRTWENKITRDGRVKNIFQSTSAKEFVKILGEDKTVTASDLISKIPSCTTDFKQQLCNYIIFAYESNFKNISNEDKLTDSELNSLYKKGVEYIELLTQRMINEKQISKIDSSLDKMKEDK